MTQLENDLDQYIKGKSKEICHALDICYITWRRKLTGKSDITRNEIQILHDDFGIPINIFFKEQNNDKLD